MVLILERGNWEDDFIFFQNYDLKSILCNYFINSNSIFFSIEIVSYQKRLKKRCFNTVSPVMSLKQQAHGGSPWPVGLIHTHTHTYIYIYIYTYIVFPNFFIMNNLCRPKANVVDEQTHASSHIHNYFQL